MGNVRYPSVAAAADVEGERAAESTADVGDAERGRTAEPVADANGGDAEGAEGGEGDFGVEVGGDSSGDFAARRARTRASREESRDRTAPFPLARRPSVQDRVPVMPARGLW